MILDRPMRLLVQRVKPRLASTRLVRKALYDVSNATGFASLYEHEKMLADRVRVDAYHQAIHRLIGPDDVVLDLGTGTGILALFAAQAGAERVYAIDHSPFIEVARQVAQANGLDRVSFVHGNSRDYSPTEKVDVVVHEQMGDDLFNENMIENLLDLRRRMLKDGGRIVPGRFELYIEPVALDPDLTVPYLWENQIHGLDFRFLDGHSALEPYKKTGYQWRWLVKDRSMSPLLTEPRPILTVDLHTIESADDLPTVFEESRLVTREGMLGGFCVYFRAIFDEQTSLTTDPRAAPTHWGNRLFRTPQRAYEPGDKLSYRIDIGDLTRSTTWSVRL